ncbi:MAG: hypothetical protein KUG77_26610 [Nannocystaceae bacterium]|nr:hypothetical protein [Nannocystaceae bacterium]
MKWGTAGLASLALLVGCGDVERDDRSSGIVPLATAGGDPTGTGGSQGSGGVGADDDGSGGDDSGGLSGGPGGVFDVGGLPPNTGGDAPQPQKGCSKIDFVFVVDNSLSMEDDQANLVANFPALIEGIESTLDEVDDYHVGVVATDAYGWNSPNCKFMGGLVTQTGGDASSGQVCGPFAEGHNYMTEQDDLSESFACAARMGVGGFGAEAPMDALKAAIGGNLAGAGQCNEGFIRDDALLVAVVITDEWDGPGDPEFLTSMGTPQDWYNNVVAVKNTPENAAVVTLVNYQDGPCPPAEPVNDGQRLVEFTNFFGPTGFVGGICDEFGPTFEQAVSLIDEACSNFVPPEG